MKIGIDCDGVLRNFISDLKDNIKENYPEHADKIKTPETWNWEDWLPFWTEEESEKYIFEDNYLDFFGIDASPIKSSVEDWSKLTKSAKQEIKNRFKEWIDSESKLTEELLKGEEQ